MGLPATTERWSRRHIVALALVFLAGMLIRVVLLPTQGFAPDLDQFVVWVHGIAVGGLGHAYDQNLSFPATMAWIWGLLALVEPAFKTVINSSDMGIRVLMKLPATLADFGIAGLLVYAFRARPVWAVVSAAIALFHPAVLDVSAWWGQYESIYVFFALAAVVFALNGRNGLAAIAIAICLMTKPQALPFILPFAAWFWAHGGWREVIRTAAIGLAVIVVLWLPFVAAGGPINYLGNLADYQNNVFAFLSLNAWNVWWLVQVAAGGGFVPDQTTLIGPVTMRMAGYALAGLLSVVVALIIARDPTPRTFILGLAASTLIWFSFLTGMHERYAYAALIFLLLLIPERRMQWLYLVFSVVFVLNLWSAIPPAPVFRDWLPYPGLQSIAGAVVMIAITLLSILWLGSRSPRGADAGAPDPRVAVADGAASA